MNIRLRSDMLVAALQLNHASWTELFHSSLSLLTHDQSKNKYRTKVENFYFFYTTNATWRHVTLKAMSWNLAWVSLDNKSVWQHFPNVLFRLMTFCGFFFVVNCWSEYTLTCTLTCTLYLLRGNAWVNFCEDFKNAKHANVLKTAPSWDLVGLQPRQNCDQQGINVEDPSLFMVQQHLLKQHNETSRSDADRGDETTH